MAGKSKALLLLNIGSPESYKVKDVRKYLRQFLSDPRVINIPAFFRYLLVSGIIVPFRAPKSAAKYREIWTDKGSPLITYTKNLAGKLSDVLQSEFDVYFAMRYGNPSIENVLSEIEKQSCSELIVFPMYPQYADSTTGSSLDMVFKKIKKWDYVPETRVVNSFWDEPAYMRSMISKINTYDVKSYDHVVISFHGLPLSQVYEAHKSKTCEEEGCRKELNDENKNCYQATCYATARKIASELDLPESKFSIGFQSRLSKNWLSPFTDDILVNLAQNKSKRVLVICPSFVADCLETLHEIEIEYARLFKDNGGEELVMVQALNSDEYWAEALVEIIKQ